MFSFSLPRPPPDPDALFAPPEPCNVGRCTSVDVMALYQQRLEEHANDPTQADWAADEAQLGDAFMAPNWLRTPSGPITSPTSSAHETSSHSSASSTAPSAPVPAAASSSSTPSPAPAEPTPEQPDDISMVSQPTSSTSCSSILSAVSRVGAQIAAIPTNIASTASAMARSVGKTVSHTWQKPGVRERKRRIRSDHIHGHPVKSQALPRPARVETGADPVRITYGKTGKYKDSVRFGKRGKRAGSLNKPRNKLDQRLLENADVATVKAFDVTTAPIAASATQGTLNHGDVPSWPLSRLAAHLKTFLPFRFDENRVLVLTDAYSRVFCIRSNVPAFMDGLHDEVVEHIDHFTAKVTSMPLDKNAVRGKHKYYILGPHRQSAKEAFLIAWHRENKKACDELMAKNLPNGRINPIHRLAGHINKVLQTYAPEVYKKMAAISTNGQARMFGVFHQMCINAPGEDALRVQCGFHVDQKNVPFFCGVWTYSKGPFDHRRRAWLVLWEANVMIELPRGCVVLYPSALFAHFNVDIDDIEVHWTREDDNGELEWDTERNGTRGSIVFFTQGSMYQYSEHGMPLGKAREIRKADGTPLEPSSRKGNPQRKTDNFRLFTVDDRLHSSFSGPK